MIQYPFIVSATLVQQLVAEGLLKYGIGNPRVKFPVPLHFFDELDVFYNFRLQDLMGPSSTGAGEQGRYYYIESLDYDFMGDQIHVVGIDLQYILKRYFILGDETALASNWSAASENDRMFGYLCSETEGPNSDQFQFADGAPGKALVNEGLLEDY
jgi:hypothetical protein